MPTDVAPDERRSPEQNIPGRPLLTARTGTLISTADAPPAAGPTPGEAGIFTSAGSSPPPPVPSDCPCTVSVVIPAFNGAKELGRTLASVAAQGYPRLDLLVVDDGSQDGTAETAERFLQDHPSLGRMFRHETNWGLSRTLNHGIQETTGDAVLVLHQDIELAANDWVARAVQDLTRAPNVAIVTGNYGIPATEEVNFAQRVFGVMRRQFHVASASRLESVTFAEFKCDLVRRSMLLAVGGFPARFRIAGEDLWVSCAMRAQGWEILKDFSLPGIQRFTGTATTVLGNLGKEFTFGKVITGTLFRFRATLARGLQRTPYSRSRSWNRASQPFVVLAMLIAAILWALTGNLVCGGVLLAFLVGRLGYYVVRLYPGLRSILSRTGRALAESFLGAPLGLASDCAYTFGLAVGALGWALGRTL